MSSVNDRVFDLMEILSKQYFVHPNLNGSNSIKAVLKPGHFSMAITQQNVYCYGYSKMKKLRLLFKEVFNIQLSCTRKI